MGILHGAGQDRVRVDVEQPVPLELVLTPAVGDHAQRLLDLRVGVLGVDAERATSPAASRRDRRRGRGGRPRGRRASRRARPPASGGCSRTACTPRRARCGSSTSSAATQVRKISGAVMCAYHLRQWCSTAQTRSKPICSASTACSTQSRMHLLLVLPSREGHLRLEDHRELHAISPCCPASVVAGRHAQRESNPR